MPCQNDCALTLREGLIDMHFAFKGHKLMDFLRGKAEHFEQRSIDEAYLDFTGSVGGFEEAERIAEGIKNEIRGVEGITCSIGIGPNKLVAKMASKENKPDGLTIVNPAHVKGFLFPKPVSKLFGVGPRAMEVFIRLGIKTIKDLAGYDINILSEGLGKTKARLLWERANGIDNEPVEDSEKQQASRIATLDENTRDFARIFSLLEKLSVEVHAKAVKQGVKFKTVSIIAISTDLEIRTKSRTLDYYSSGLGDIKKHASNLMKKFLDERPEMVLRRCGVSVSNFQRNEKEKQAAGGQRTLGEF